MFERVVRNKEQVTETKLCHLLLLVAKTNTRVLQKMWKILPSVKKKTDQIIRLKINPINSGNNDLIEHLLCPVLSAEDTALMKLIFSLVEETDSRVEEGTGG